MPPCLPALRQWAADFEKAFIMALFTPRSLISGRVSAVKSKPLQAAFKGAAAVLGSEQIALIFSSFKGDVWYLAAPAADLAAHAPAASALAAALPGSNGHDGDGAYITDLAAGLQAVVVKQGDNLHSFVGTPVMVKRFVVLEGATATHTCTGPGMAWLIPSDLAGRLAARLNMAVTFSGLLVALLAAGTWLWAASGVSQLQALREDLHNNQMAAWTAAVQSLTSAPYPKALAHLQTAVEQAAREKGSLVQFEHKDGRSTWSLNVNQRVVAGGAN